MFVWAQLANEGNAAEIATIAAKQNIMLAPGNLFSPHQAPSSWLRFNVAHCDDERIFEILSTFK